MAPGNPASYLLGMTLAGEIDRFRESVESVWGSLNLVHLSYHHSHLLIKSLNPPKTKGFLRTGEVTYLWSASNFCEEEEGGRPRRV